ncbi:hypothetical protein DEO72_LG4g702 [Vigna unguiculata]|uniref:Uncharacterized protein n=1 Tax=Vigna unguiculata TaxID=3917 RepID=A0A4D6LMM0_VIGUN|nr:hypothetical protein DEO72_LG4g702 [Vigna unguiculata]
MHHHLQNQERALSMSILTMSRPGASRVLKATFADPWSASFLVETRTVSDHLRTPTFVLDKHMTTARVNQVAFVADNQAQTMPQVVKNKCWTLPQIMKVKLSLPRFQCPPPKLPSSSFSYVSLVSNIIPPCCLLRSSAQSPSFSPTKRSPSSQFDIIASLISNNPRVRLLRSSTSPPSSPITQDLVSLVSNNQKVTFFAIRHRLPRFQQPKSPPSSQFNVASLVSNNARVGRIWSSTLPLSFQTTQKSIFLAVQRRLPGFQQAKRRSSSQIHEELVTFAIFHFPQVVNNTFSHFPQSSM